MNHTSCFLVLGLFFLTLSPVAQTQWTQTSGPKGWQIQEIVSIGSTLYAGTMWGGSVFVSTNGGYAWRSASRDLPAGRNGIKFLRGIGATLFAGTNFGLFRSKDGGSSWSSANVGLKSSSGWYWPRDIATLGSRIFLSNLDGVYESLDEGSHWLLSNSGPPPAEAPTASSGFAAVDTFLFFGNRHGVYRTSINATVWTSTEGRLPDTVVTVITAVGRSIFVLACPKSSSTRPKLYRSTDVGVTWAQMGNGLPDTLYGTLKGIESDLYQIEWQRVYRSSDLGASWSLMIDTLADIWTANGIRYAQESYVQETLLQSTDHGVTWASLSEPPIGTYISALATNGNRLVASTWNDQWDYITTDRGNSWSRLGKERVNLNVSSFAFCGPYLIAGGTSTDGGIDVSTDNGLTWARVTNGSDAQIEYLAVDSPYVFASGNGMWVSTDCGFSWAASNAGLRSNIYLGAMATLNSKLFVAMYWWDSIFVSSDKGSSWKPAGRAGQGFLSITSLLAEGGTLFAGTDGQGIWRSTDEGKTWAQTITGLEDTIVNDIAATRRTLFAATQDKGVFASTDAGGSWEPVNEGLAAPHVNRLLVHGQDLYAGTLNEGVWRRPLSEVTGVGVEGQTIPTAFRLEQNYPNPFNPSTTIKYELPKSSIVRLSVFDILGREVSVLVNERRDAGVHEVKFDGSNLASGVYVYRIQAGTYVQTRKLLLLR